MNMGSGELPQADTVWRSIDPFQLPQQPSMMAQLNSKPSNRIEKKHKCNICGGFFDYNSLRTHLYSHKGGQHELRAFASVEGFSRKFSVAPEVRRQKDPRKKEKAPILQSTTRSPQFSRVADSSLKSVSSRGGGDTYSSAFDNKNYGIGGPCPFCIENHLLCSRFEDYGDSRCLNCQLTDRARCDLAPIPSTNQNVLPTNEDMQAQGGGGSDAMTMLSYLDDVSDTSLWASDSTGGPSGSVNSFPSSMNGSLHGYTTFHPQEQSPIFMNGHHSPAFTNGHNSPAFANGHQSPASTGFVTISPGLPPPPVELNQTTPPGCDICEESMRMQNHMEWQKHALGDVRH